MIHKQTEELKMKTEKSQTAFSPQEDKGIPGIKVPFQVIVIIDTDLVTRQLIVEDLKELSSILKGIIVRRAMLKIKILSPISLKK